MSFGALKMIHGGENTGRPFITAVASDDEHTNTS